jgi:hypothetical protein
LVDLLARLGYKPVKPSGKELIYVSMLRDSDITPSFSVDDRLSVWYDHGLGKGGNIIDFAQAYWQHLSFQEVLEKIVAVCNTEITANGFANDARSRKRSPVKIPHYEVEDVRDIGNNTSITEYLKSRGIWQAAQGRIHEVYYYVEDQKKQRKNFFAAGWQNEFGSWEVRNLYFKGCLGRKAITFIEGDENKLSVFEGYLNYLSWLTENPFSWDAILVLNTTSLLEAATRKAREFNDVSLYFDRDQSGYQASIDFIQAVPNAVDCSTQYLNFNDYNDKLRATQKTIATQACAGPCRSWIAARG